MAAIKKTNISSNANPVKKKTLIIAVCVIILILIPVIFFFLSYKKTSYSPPENTITSIKTDSYTLSYPTAWEENESAAVNGGEVFYLQPPHADPAVNPHVILQVTSASQANIYRMNLAYVLLKYQKSTVTVNGTEAQKYNQILPSVHGPFHSVAYVFIAKGSLYLLELGYTQIRTDPELENEFTQIVNSFTLH